MLYNLHQVRVCVCVPVRGFVVSVCICGLRVCARVRCVFVCEFVCACVFVCVCVCVVCVGICVRVWLRDVYVSCVRVCVSIHTHTHSVTLTLSYIHLPTHTYTHILPPTHTQTDGFEAKLHLGRVEYLKAKATLSRFTSRTCCVCVCVCLSM